MKKIGILLGFIVFLFLVFLLGVKLAYTYGKPCTCYGLELDEKCLGIRTVCTGLGKDLYKEVSKDNKLDLCDNCPLYSPFPPGACPLGTVGGEDVIDIDNNCYCPGPPKCK